MNTKIEIFRKFDQLVRNQYDTIPLRDIGDISISNESSTEFFTRIVRSKVVLKPFEYSTFKFLHEIKIISQDVKYYTALLYYLKPFITNSSITGTYNQTQEDRRYMMFASVGFQAIYNYWDRIGNLLDKFFKTGLQDSSIYLSRVLNNFPNEFKGSKYYIWLNDTYHHDIKNILGQRDHIVHFYQLESEYYWKVMEHNNDLLKISKIQKEKESFPEEFKKQLELMVLGFEYALNLINELHNKKEQ
jgi:hypothetical protein